MGKQGKKRTAKLKNIRPSYTSTEERESKRTEAGLTDKLSRIFYSWMKKKIKTHPMSLRVENFEIKSLICEGTFGKVMLAVNVNTKLTAAAKIEPIDEENPQLITEFKIYERLGSYKPGFVKIYHYGPCNKGYYNALVMELLGPDLDDLFVACNGKLSYKSVLMIAIQTLQLIQHVHSNQVIFRDVKPENFCIGHIYQNKEKIIYIIDFGLSKVDALHGISNYSTIFKKLFNSVDSNKSKNEDILCNYLVGTARYMSINAHYGGDQSQRDDLESLGYMYMYFLRNHLPWMGLSRTDNIQDHYKCIAKLKEQISLDDMIKDYPAFIDYMKYVKTLDHMETPNYNYLINLMKNAMKVNKYTNDAIFEWTELMNQKYLHKALVIDPDD